MDTNGHRADSAGLLTADQAADLLGHSPRHVRRLIARGALEGSCAPYRVRREAINAYLARRTGAAHEPPLRAEDDGERVRMGVYAITHRASGRTYIGSSLDIEARWRDHRATLGRGRHSNRSLQEAWTTDGPAAFTWSVRDYAESEDELPALEDQWIQTARPIYNEGRGSRRASLRPRLRPVRRPRGQATGLPLARSAPQMSIDVRALTLPLAAELASARQQIERLSFEVGRLHAQLEQARAAQSGPARPHTGTLARLGRWLLRA